MPVYNNNSYSLNETSARISRFTAPSWVEDNGRATYYPSNERVRLVASRLRRERLIDLLRSSRSPNGLTHRIHWRIKERRGWASCLMTRFGCGQSRQSVSTLNVALATRIDQGTSSSLACFALGSTIGANRSDLWKH